MVANVGHLETTTAIVKLFFETARNRENALSAICYCSFDYSVSQSQCKDTTTRLWERYLLSGSIVLEQSITNVTERGKWKGRRQMGG
mmetsp:Transcript_6529/g.16110  ORF Transcript_6529/g.16110 Transcript_6529/m.16110 type:complete len:87 (+) Transcript_6529:2109-2369(+)